MQFSTGKLQTIVQNRDRSLKAQALTCSCESRCIYPGGLRAAAVVGCLAASRPTCVLGISLYRTVFSREQQSVRDCRNRVDLTSDGI